MLPVTEERVEDAVREESSKDVDVGKSSVEHTDTSECLQIEEEKDVPISVFPVNS